MSESPAFEEGSLWILGAVIAFIGNVIINLGTNLMKLAHIKVASMNRPIPATRHPLWIGGLTLFAIGNVGNFIALSLAAQSLLAAMGSIQFVSNAIFGHLLLGETISWKGIYATISIIIANVFLIFFSPHSTKEYTADQLVELYYETPYIVFLAIEAVVGLSVLLFYYFNFSSIPLSRSSSAQLKEASWRSKLLPLCYALLSAIVGTHSVMFAKSISSLLRVTSDGDNQFTEEYTYIVIVVWAMTMFFWMRRLNIGLARFEAVVIVPILQIVWVTLSVVEGTIYFEEYLQMRTIDYLGFSIAFLVMIVSMYFLAPEKKKERPDAFDDIEPHGITLGEPTTPIPQTVPAVGQLVPTIFNHSPSPAIDLEAGNNHTKMPPPPLPYPSQLYELPESLTTIGEKVPRSLSMGELSSSSCSSVGSDTNLLKKS